MPAAGQRRHFRRRTAAEDSHRGGGIGPHVQQAAAAQFAVIAKIADRQRRNDELRGDLRQRTVFGDERRQRLELRMIAEHRRLRDACD